MFNYEPTTVRFQLAWVLLHVIGAVMNLGSAWYHCQRLVASTKVTKRKLRLVK